MSPSTFRSFRRLPSRGPRSSSRRRVAALASVMLVAAVPAAASGEPPREVPAPAGGFGWPVDPHTVIHRFDPPEVPWGSGHRGVDLGTTPAAIVRAPGPGTVTFSGVIAGRGVLSVRHPQGFSTTYEPVTARVPKGTEVTRGQQIGVLDTWTGSAPHCDAACLHWGYRVTKNVYRDPLTLIGAVRPVLLPPLP